MKDIKGELYQSNIERINYHLFLKAVKAIRTTPISSRAPLGYSSDSILLYGSSRRSEVSVRNHSGMYSMLITTPAGNFLFNGGFSMSLTDINAAKGLYGAFKIVKHLVSNQ